MGERSDGTWSAKQVGLSAPRQNGKSQLIVARALAGALLFGERKIVISAHSQDTARETFSKFLEMRDASPALDERIDKVMNALNREYIKFKNGAVIQFKARTVSGSRGFSSDCLLLDEAQILGMPAWVSINSTMSARPNPQIWLLGTPPTPEDNGEVFTSIRTAALEGRSRTLAYLEWSAAPGDDPALTATRASANPAWSTRINHEVVQGEFETYPPDRFALDRLGIWRSEASALVMPTWAECRVDALAPVVHTVGAAVAWDRKHSSIGCAGMSGETMVVGAVDRREGSGWLIAELFRLQTEYQCAVVVDEKGPTSDLIPAMRAAGINVTTLTSTAVADATASIYDRVQERTLAHPGHPDLDAAVAVTSKRDTERGFMWARKTSAGDISMLEAITLAAWNAAQAAPTVW